MSSTRAALMPLVRRVNPDGPERLVFEPTLSMMATTDQRSDRQAVPNDTAPEHKRRFSAAIFGNSSIDR